MANLKQIPGDIFKEWSVSPLQFPARQNRILMGCLGTMGIVFALFLSTSLYNVVLLSLGTPTETFWFEKHGNATLVIPKDVASYDLNEYSAELIPFTAVLTGPVVTSVLKFQLDQPIEQGPFDFEGPNGVNLTRIIENRKPGSFGFSSYYECQGNERGDTAFNANLIFSYERNCTATFDTRPAQGSWVDCGTDKIGTEITISGICVLCLESMTQNTAEEIQIQGRIPSFSECTPTSGFALRATLQIAI